MSYRSVTTRTSTIGGGGGGGGEDIMTTKRNYQVYRGMSPSTSNRMESRMKELEDALEQEREAHGRTERELAEAHAQLDSMSERLDEFEGHSVSQSEITRRKDQELLKVKKDFELVSVQHESSEASLKKRHQDIINDLNDQLERMTKLKSKVDKEKQQLTIEIDGLSTTLDSVTKAKNYAETKLEGVDDQLRKLKSQVEEFTRVNQELKNLKDRLSSENAELSRQLHDMDMNSGNFSKTKSQMQHMLDETKSKLEDESRIRLQLDIQFNSIQSDFDKMKGQFEDETEAANTLRSSNQKLQTEYQQLRAKYDKDIGSRTDELEEIRRKLMARIAELESTAEQFRNKASKLEKDKSKLTIDIRDISVQLDEANGALNEYVKRLKQSEHVNIDLQKRVDELGSDLQNGSGENQRLLAEITRMKVQLTDQQAKIDALTRDNSKLSESLRESESSNKDLTRQVQELTSIRVQLQGERDSLLAELNDTKDAMKDLQARLDASNNQINILRIELDTKLREKDEEMENIRRGGQRGVEELQRTILELETRYKGENSRLKKKYESESHELTIQIENLNRSNIDFAKTNKLLSVKLKETETLLDTERRAALEARESATMMERKLIALQTELEDVRSLLDASDKARKNAENELADATTHINEININVTSLTGDRRRMESDIQAMHRDLDEAIIARRAAEEKAEHNQNELNRLSDQYRSEHDKYSNSENVRKQLEIQIKEITIRLEESESSKDGKKTVTKLQNRVRELEMELEAEQRRSRDSVAETRKVQKQLQDLRAQADEDHRACIELSEQVNTLQIRLVALKRQVEESEDVLGITMNKYRKCQQLLEDAERRADKAEKSITLVRHTTTTSGPRPGGLRAMSVSREISKVVRI